MIFINGYIHIRNCALVNQGQVVFKRPGTLDDFLSSAFDALAPGYPKFYKMDRLSKLGFLASEMLLKDRRIHERYTPEEVGIILSNANASEDTDLRYLESEKKIASPSLFVYTLPNIVAGEISIRNGFKGETAFFIFPEFDAAQMADYINIVMASEKTRCCIAGWVNVLNDRHDVFLYLAEKQGNSNALEHTAVQLQKLYQANYGAVDVQSQNTDH